MFRFLSNFKFLSVISILGLLVACACPLKQQSKAGMEADISTSSDREFSFTYAVQVYPTADALDIFLPIAQTNTQQTIQKMEIESAIDGEIGQEVIYGNKFWHASLPDGLADTLDISITYHVIRPVNSADRRQTQAIPELTQREEELFLLANVHVPVGGTLVDSIRAALAPAGPATLDKARLIYDYVIKNMEYKKTGTGWGNGDTYWACSEKYGNCTDFHALFTSLARAEQIPSRFEIGFPVPTDRDEGAISGYHCWVNFYLPETGWFPVDASEARKDPSRQDLLFGTQPPDRIQFTVGRDLELGAGHKSGPLNYFVYPHLEQNGKYYSGFSRSFKFKTIG